MFSGELRKFVVHAMKKRVILFYSFLKKTTAHLQEMIQGKLSPIIIIKCVSSIYTCRHCDLCRTKSTQTLSSARLSPLWP